LNTVCSERYLYMRQGCCNKRLGLFDFRHFSHPASVCVTRLPQLSKSNVTSATRFLPTVCKCGAVVVLSVCLLHWWSALNAIIRLTFVINGAIDRLEKLVSKVIRYELCTHSFCRLAKFLWDHWTHGAWVLYEKCTIFDQYLAISSKEYNIIEERGMSVRGGNKCDLSLSLWHCRCGYAIRCSAVADRQRSL